MREFILADAKSVFTITWPSIRHLSHACLQWHNGFGSDAGCQSIPGD
jgi:hypothetical protein